jgi:hypothetical protein
LEMGEDDWGVVRKRRGEVKPQVDKVGESSTVRLDPMEQRHAVRQKRARYSLNTNPNLFGRIVWWKIFVCRKQFNDTIKHPTNHFFFSRYGEGRSRVYRRRKWAAVSPVPCEALFLCPACAWPSRAHAVSLPLVLDFSYRQGSCAQFGILWSVNFVMHSSRGHRENP